MTAMKTVPGKREKYRITLTTVQNDIETARALYRQAEYVKSFDLYEQMVEAYPELSITLLTDLYEHYRALPQRDRYSLYQSRLFNFGIMSGDKVLDVGSGHIPFPLATHLSDITLTDHGYGRAGVPFKHVDGKPVFECSVENMPFADKEFDFVYCSHVLEHAKDPARACRELMRVAKRGFIECPSPGKDIFLNSAKISNHTWGVEKFDNRLIFFEYTPEQIEAFQCDILQQMHSSPQTDREKAFSALVYLKADVVNTMMLWENDFDCEVRRHGASQSSAASRLEMPKQDAVQSTTKVETGIRTEGAIRPLRFMQVHTFYPAYMNDLYTRYPNLSQASFDEQIKMLVSDGFSGIHMFAPYMRPLGYESHLIIANNPCSQGQWLRENNFTLDEPDNWLYEVVRRQIENMAPDVLYLSDPIIFDSRFIATLAWKPALILGWRAANIPEGTDWSLFDVLMSSLSRLRQVALGLGAKAAEHFFPGYPVWINDRIASYSPCFDVVFSGSWTLGQHPARNRYLQLLAEAASNPVSGFSLGLYLSGETGTITPDVARYNLGPKFGVDMHAALKTGRIVLDARGILEIKNSATGEVTDLAGQQTANMRIFEVTGSGVFLLAEHYENISDYFEPGVEIETFRDSDEMLRKIRYYLAHPDEREAIARRGQERCLRDYSMERRAAELDAIIRKHCVRKSGEQTSDKTADSHFIQSFSPQERTNTSLSVHDLAEQAQAALVRDDIEQAFSLLIEAKKLKFPLVGLDYLRSRCFLRMGQHDAAAQALREELRWFPENSQAQELLKQLQSSLSAPPLKNEDAEFQAILQEIRPYTMLSEERLYSMFSLTKYICERNIPGNFIECGVAAGGSSALLAYVIKHYSKSPRRLFSFDSFSGMPVPSEADAHAGVAADETGWGTGTCSAPETSVREICNKLGVVDVLTTVKGYFEDTLPQWRDRVGMIAFLHLDGDWYSSTRAILDNLYDRMVNNGMLQIDDYGHWEGCRRAVHEFELERNFSFNMTVIDGTGVWCVKPDRFPANPAIPMPLQERFAAVDPIPKGVEGQMSLNERFQLFHTITQLLPPLSNPFRFVEVGSFAGGSLLLTYLTLKEMGMQVQGFSVDPGRHPSLLKILEIIGPEISYLPMFSHEAVASITRTFQEGNLPQFIFIDGDHTYEGVRRDILDYYPLLAPGGIMLFHDWLPPLDALNREAILYHHGGHEPGIRQACEETLEQAYGLAPLELPLLYPTDPTQTQPHLPIIPGVFSTIRAYRKPDAPEKR